MFLFLFLFLFSFSLFAAAEQALVCKPILGHLNNYLINHLINV